MPLFKEGKHETVMKKLINLKWPLVYRSLNFCLQNYAELHWISSTVLSYIIKLLQCDVDIPSHKVIWL